ncbi:MAG: hypothetical protein FRX49_08758 [Trebouxia sp. A1-2]|nr:MAG: hypothetical protein FRX49_08758 [Trebouxia sp. A1-2]
MILQALQACNEFDKANHSRFWQPKTPGSLNEERQTDSCCGDEDAGLALCEEIMTLCLPYGAFAAL